jgi:hypothetical protein
MILYRNILPISDVCYLKPCEEEEFQIKRNRSCNFSKKLNHLDVTQLKCLRSFGLSAHLETFCRKLDVICMYVCMYVCICVCVCMYVCVCMCVCM